MEQFIWLLSTWGSRTLATALDLLQLDMWEADSSRHHGQRGLDAAEEGDADVGSD